MKTLIINGSPHKNGNTSFLANLLSKKLKSETDIVFLSDINFKSCCDCESCKKNSLCVLDDDAQNIINSLNNYDNIVLATPLYYNQPTGDMMCFLSRFQLWFLNPNLKANPKKAGIIVVGGGDCVVNSVDAEKTMRIALRSINTAVVAYARSLHTSTTPSKNDTNAMLEIEEMAEKLNNL